MIASSIDSFRIYVVRASLFGFPAKIWFDWNHFDCLRWTSVKGFTAMITEVHDIAGQHEMIADNLNNTVVKELQNLVQQVKQDRKKVFEIFSFIF